MIAKVSRHFLDLFRASAAPRETRAALSYRLGTTSEKSGFFFDLHSNPANQSHPSTRPDHQFNHISTDPLGSYKVLFPRFQSISRLISDIERSIDHHGSEERCRCWVGLQISPPLKSIQGEHSTNHRSAGVAGKLDKQCTVFHFVLITQVSPPPSFFRGIRVTMLPLSQSTCPVTTISSMLHHGLEQTTCRKKSIFCLKDLC